MRRRVVITGIGAVTPLGLSARETWEGLVAGRSGIDRITLFDPANTDSKIAGEVKGFDPTQYLSRKEARRTDRFVQFAVAAALEAVEDAGLNESLDGDSVGVIIGSGIGGIETWCQQHNVLLEQGPGRISPFFIPMMISNMASGYVSILLKARGPNTSIVSACASGAQAIGTAFDIIRRGDAEIIIAGGSEAAVVELAVAGFCSMKALSRRNDEPQRASRPFDAERDGFVIAEGAGIVVLESLESAEKRGAEPYAELIGYGLSGDAHDIVQPPPNGEGAARAMEMCLRDARLAPEEVDYINAHGTATLVGDPAETRAIKNVFGEHAYKLLISSNKSEVGHMLGAAGAVEAIATALSIKENIVPPTINLDQPDPECDLNYVPGEARRHDIRVAMSNSFGFGGQNAALLMREI